MSKNRGRTVRFSEYVRAAGGQFGRDARASIALGLIDPERLDDPESYAGLGDPDAARRRFEAWSRRRGGEPG